MTAAKTPGMDKLLVSLKGLGKGKGQVGWFDSAKYENGTPVAYVATIQEYGWGPIPPRSFIRPTVTAQKTKWSKVGGQYAKMSLEGKAAPNDALKAVVEAARGDIAQAISSVTEPALSDATLAARARRNNSSTKPLVDSGLMLATLTTQVKEK